MAEESLYTLDTQLYANYVESWTIWTWSWYHPRVNELRRNAEIRCNTCPHTVRECLHVCKNNKANLVREVGGEAARQKDINSLSELNNRGGGGGGAGRGWDGGEGGKRRSKREHRRKTKQQQGAKARKERGLGTFSQLWASLYVCVCVQCEKRQQQVSLQEKKRSGGGARFSVPWYISGLMQSRTAAVTVAGICKCARRFHQLSQAVSWNPNVANIRNLLPALTLLLYIILDFMQHHPSF